MKIGYTWNGYQEKRNIINAVPNNKYTLSRDYYSFIRRIADFIGIKIDPDKHQMFNDFNLNKCDVIHLYNSVSYGKTPWVATFESLVPRFGLVLAERDRNPERVQKDAKVIRAIEALAGNACKGVLVRCDSTLELQTHFLELFPAHKANILGKIKKITVPQESKTITPAVVDPKKIKFMFVGGAFFRKGGREILEAFIKLRKQGQKNFELTLVSDLGPDNYATKTGPSDTEYVKALINQNLDWINYSNSLPNNQVLELMAEANVGLLLSYADTYGFSVLEFQAHGCPVITTDIRAFPELNSDKAGWLIPIPKREIGGEGKYNEEGGRERISNAISSGLDKLLPEIINNSAEITKKGEQALKKVQKEHCPELFARQLQDIYQSAGGRLSSLPYSGRKG